MPKPPINLAVLVSGSGSTLQNLVDQIAANRLGAKISLVIASRPDIFALQRAASANLPSIVIERKSFSSVGSFSEQIFTACREARTDLVCLAGWLSLLQLPPSFIGRVMNIHPALLPSFGGRGMYGHHVHQAVLKHGCKISGCTVHFLDDQYDHGPIILQLPCPVMEGDTPETLAARVFEQEKIAYPQAIRLFQRGQLAIDGQTVRVQAIE